MKNLYMAVDIGSTSIKGVLVDKNLNIISKYYLKIRDDYLITYGRVINKLRSSVDIDNYKVIWIKVKRKRKRLIERSLGRNNFINEISATYNYVINKYSNVNAVIDIGDSLKIINIKNNKIVGYNIDNINHYGKFIDKVIEILNIENINNINIYHKGVKLDNQNTILFNYNIINTLLNKYTKEEILLGVYDLVINNIINNINNINKSNIVICGGLSLNKPFINLLKNKLNKNIIVENNIFIAAIGSLITKEKELIHE